MEKIDKSHNSTEVIKTKTVHYDSSFNERDPISQSLTS